MHYKSRTRVSLCFPINVMGYYSPSLIPRPVIYTVHDRQSISCLNLNHHQIRSEAWLLLNQTFTFAAVIFFYRDDSLYLRSMCSKVYRGKSYKTQQPIDDISCPTVFSCLTCLDTPSHFHIYLYYLVAKMMCVCVCV